MHFTAISLTSFGDILFSREPWCDLSDISFMGCAWHYRESPLAIPPDILYDPATRKFAGLVFPSRQSDKDSVNEWIRGLDARCIRHVQNARYLSFGRPGETYCEDFALEVTWLPCAQYGSQCAHLHFGQFAIGYPIEQPNIRIKNPPWTKPLGLMLLDLDELLREFRLNWPSTLGRPAEDHELVPLET